MAKTTKMPVDRRGFLKGAAAGAAALAAVPESAQAQPQQGGAAQGAQQAAQRGTAGVPGSAVVARESGASPSAYRVVERPGSDFMVDVLKSLNIDYLASNPGSTFESLHESIINYGQNKSPEFLTVTHEENAVAMAHGYAKVEWKPMMALLHGPLGLQHAGMAIYNAYCDRVPIYMVAGNHLDGGDRRTGVQTFHSAQDLGLLVRDYVKWDDQPYSLRHFAESAVRAYKIAMTPPMGPVLITAGYEIQGHAIPEQDRNIKIPPMTLTGYPQGDSNSVREAAKLLVNAERPAIVPERAIRTEAGLKNMVALAELLGAPVRNQERMNFPSLHPLNGAGGPGYTPDVLLLLDMNDIGAETNRAHATGAKVISISSVSLNHKANIQDFGHYAAPDIEMGADTETTLPSLIEECRKLVTADTSRKAKERAAKIAEAHRAVRTRDWTQAADSWDASPVALGRIAAELWPLVEKEDWSFVSPQGFFGNWPNRLWNMSKPSHYIGSQGAGGMGYGLPASVGAALANKKHGRLSINVQTDGDFNYSPGVLWTACHHQIPLLSIMHNNRGYHQEVMFVEQMCSAHNRGAENSHIGTKLWQPDIDYAKIAQGYGMYAEGPITNPNDLGPALKRGIERVKKGEPVLLDVVTQPR